MKGVSKPIPISKTASPGTRSTPSKSGRPPRAPASSTSFARSVPNLAARNGSLAAAPHFGSLKTPSSFLDEMPVLELESAYDMPPAAALISSGARSLPASASAHFGGGGSTGSLVMSLSKMKILDGHLDDDDGEDVAEEEQHEEVKDSILSTAQRGFKTKEQLEEEEEAAFARRSDDDEDDEVHFQD